MHGHCIGSKRYSRKEALQKKEVNFTRQQQRQTAKSNRSRGIALITVLLLLLILSAMAVALMYTVNTEVPLQKNEPGTGLAFFRAEAGIEKMMTGLNNLYNVSPFPS